MAPVASPNPVRTLDKLDLAIDDIRRDGYTAVQVVNDPGELEGLRTLFWQFFEGLGTGIDRGDPLTWEDDRWPTNDRGIIHGYNVGWNRCSWALRQHPAVQKVFARIWGSRGLIERTDLEPDTDDFALLTSMDGICLIRPPELVHSEAQRIRNGAFRSWPHVDQSSPFNRRFETVQGLITLYDSEPGDGGLVVYHKTHIAYENKLGLLNRARLALAVPGINEGVVRNYERRKLCGPAGTLFLWDSRTIHCNEAPHIGRLSTSSHKLGEGEAVPAHRPRAVVYVCLSSARLATKQQLAKVAEAGRQRRSFGHNVYSLSLFPVWNPGTGPRGSKDPVNPKCVQRSNGWLTEDETTDAMRRLLGIIPYGHDRSSLL